MKFSTVALVLATLAVESASAASLKHAHRHAHAKKDEVHARQWTPPPGYDYHTDPAYLATAGGAPAPAATGAPGIIKPAVKNVVHDSSSGGYTGGLTGGAVKVLEGMFNAHPENDFVWKGESGGDWSNTITNKGADARIVFVNKDGVNQDGKPMGLGEAQWVQTNAPALNFKIASGESMTFQFRTGASGIFFPVRDNMGTSDFGLIKTTLGEFTIAGASTTFDVSRLWHGSGVDMEIKSDNDCVSSTKGNLCCFVCKTFEYAEACEKPGTYDIVNVGGSADCTRGPRDGDWNKPEGGCQVTKNVRTTFW